MAQTPPPTITPAPPAPQRGVRATFSNLVDAFVTWLVNAVSQFGAVATNVYNNAVDAFNNASIATSAAVTATSAASAATAAANATLWVSGQSVMRDEVKISPLDRQSYRRRTATGSGTVDPALDSTNYVPLLPLTRVFTSSEQTVTANGSLTIAHGLGVIPKHIFASVRDSTTGLNYYPGSISYAISGSILGCTITADSTNLYVQYGSNASVFSINNANALLRIRAYV